jgi:hypothetical protein
MSLGKQTSALVAGAILVSFAVALGSSSAVAASFHRHDGVAANRGRAEVQHYRQPRSYGTDESPYAQDHSAFGNAPDNW